MTTPWALSNCTGASAIRRHVRVSGSKAAPSASGGTSGGTHPALGGHGRAAPVPTNRDDEVGGGERDEDETHTRPDLVSREARPLGDARRDALGDLLPPAAARAGLPELFQRGE